MQNYVSPRAEFMTFAEADIVTASSDVELSGQFDKENPLSWYNHFYDENGNLRTDL